MNEPDSMFRLDGKVVLVTGASRGMGQAIAVALAGAGADVIGVARGDMVATRCAVEATGARFLALAADLSQGACVPPLVDQAHAWQGRLNVLVNNAGIVRRGVALGVSEADWDVVINVNLRSVFLLSQAVARCFIEQGSGGKIINTASMLSFQGGIRVPAYTASKSAVMGLTKALANEWAPHGINVNAIAPGYIATELTSLLQQDEQRCAEITARIPAGRWGRPDDVAGAAVFLASRASDYVHGHTLAVDGGWLAR
ncbi:2-dehydro-3-deoxy-D-gluconate 5-dehydrogenase KduD [Piscinibacter sp.]|uniref:2-dehydro-3-deoxy-D-gluconate 5-dehydrogenase KduD n=1 Tax=Piscinibacter sp. TaxID=1903157 RepID=UPI002C6C6F33|nr:2-dehydro-3-deoxy-D-gluconate 5-dehydrogenase KduD [Albitalea sp.]HUG22514.1 2-dehydro-3-deoxy-D-gluconate 5-dehydrogenase KduD [Albitalea sp.]